MECGPITSWQIDGKTIETVREGISGGGHSRCKAFSGTEHGIPGPERGQEVESREGGGFGTGGREGARDQSAEWWADLFS